MNLMKPISIVIFGTIAGLLLSSCGNNTEVSASSSSTVQQDGGLSETDLFKSQVTENSVEEWGFKSPEKDSFFIKSYSDPNRNYKSDELASVIPEECLEVATLLQDSEKSQAKLLSSLNFKDKTNSSNAIQIKVMAFESEKLASSRFNELLSKKDNCGSWIPKYQSGDTGLEMDLWKKTSTSNSKYLAWENSTYSEASALGLVGSAIYDIYVSIENDLNRARTVREAAVLEFEEVLKNLQR